MKIQSICIQDFRSIQLAEFSANNFNVLVGQNNHGKTNIFRAIEWFYQGKGDVAEIRNANDTNGEIVVELTFGGVQAGIDQISNAENQTKIKAVVGDDDTMRVRRSSKDAKNRDLYNPKSSEWKKQPCGVDSAFNNCIPRFEFIEATKNLKDVSGYSAKSPIGQMLGGVLSEILEKDQSYRDFREKFEALFQKSDSGIQRELLNLSKKVKGHLQQQFPDCTEVRFDVEEPSFDDLLKNFTTRLNDGVETEAYDKGDGMQRALMLAIIKIHADHRREDALGKSFIFFIDEAELHLHPSAQRQLKSALLELSQSVDQVFINTHSSVLIADECSSQTVFRVDKSSLGTKIQAVDQSGKQDVIYDLLGGNPADLLLPSNFLIVEGHTELTFLTRMVTRFYSDKPQIQIIKSRGDHEKQRQNMDAINLVLKPLTCRPIYREKLAILCDKPDQNKESSFNRFKADYSYLESNGQLHVLATSSIEESYPIHWKSTSNLSSIDKIKLAEKVADEITQEIFEREMPVVFAALSFCWDKAYSNS